MGAYYCPATVTQDSPPSRKCDRWIDTTGEGSRQLIFPVKEYVNGEWHIVAYYSELNNTYSSCHIKIHQTGQSNETSASQAPTTIDSVGSELLYWWGANSTTQENGISIQDVMNNRNNAGFHAAKLLAEDCGCFVTIIQTGQVGMPIKKISEPDSVAWYQITRNRTANAFGANFDGYDFVIFNQGQGDRDDKGGNDITYAKDWDNWYNRLLADGLITTTPPIVIIGLTPDGVTDDRDDVLQAKANQYAQACYIDTKDIDLRDAVHFSTDGLTDLGINYIYPAYKQKEPTCNYYYQ